MTQGGDGSGTVSGVPRALVEHVLDALSTSAPVGLGFWDRELRYVWVNERLAAINELAAEAHVGKSFRDVVPHLADELEPLARRVLESGDPVIGLEITAGTPGRPHAPRKWSASYYPVVGPDGERIGVGAVVEEITDRRRSERLAELQHAVTSILGAAAGADDAVAGVLEVICTRLDCDLASYRALDGSRVVWSAPGTHPGRLRAALDGDAPGLAARAVEERRVEWIPELAPGASAVGDAALADGLAACFAVPVSIAGEPVGAVEVFARERREVDGELVASLEALCGQLGQFLLRRRVEGERLVLLERERAARAEAEAAAATLRKLERVSQAALAHLSLQDLLDALLARIVELLDADTAAILLVGDDGRLHVRATMGLDADLHRALAIPLGEGLAGRVAESRRPLLVPDLSQVELFSPMLRHRGINSLVAIPLVVEDSVIGVVHAGSEAYAQFVEDDVRLLELIADRIALAINQSSLYEAERAAQGRLRFLGEASALLASSLDVDETLRRVTALAVPQFADLCTLDLLRPDGTLERVAVAHADPARAASARRIVTEFPPPSLTDEVGVGAVVRSGEAVVANDIDEAALRAALADRPAYLEEVLRLGLHATMIVPLVLRERPLGAVTFVATDSYRRFGAADLEFAQELASRAAVALENARLFREAAVGRDRLGFLAEASALLGASLDVERTLEELAQLVAARVCDWCSVHLAGEPGGAMRLANVTHRDPDRVSALRAGLLHPDAAAVVAGVVGSGEPGTEHGRLTVPLAARGRTLGALTLGWDSSPPRDEGEVEFAVDLARRAAVALDNAQLYRAAAERAQASRVLASVGDGVFLVDHAGVIRTWNRAAAAATGLPGSSVVDRPALEAIPGWSAIAPRIAVVSGRSTAPRPESLPLDLGGREVWLSIHGVAVPDGVVYAFRDLTEERALEQMRTEFVSTVSHELRTPLAAIYGAAMTLRRADVELDESQRARLLDVVSGEADRLARTVNDILWASRLDSDSLHVTIQNCDPVTLVDDVVKAQEVHLDRAHTLVVDADEDLPPVAGDPDKVGRVLINLVDNAVKYSPDGGRVRVAVAVAGTHVRFSVADEGLGIPLAEQRRVFEKFYRLDPNMNRGVGGTGLGLYICRELVRRMDGRIWVESPGLGRGSTFHVELPAA